MKQREQMLENKTQPCSKNSMKLSEAGAAGLSGSLKKQANNKTIVQEQ